jgi:hypothetical protein
LLTRRCLLAYTTTFNDDLGVIVVRAKHSVNAVEIAVVLDELLNLPGFREGLCLVVDFRGSTTPITADEIRHLADYAKRADAKWGSTKWAFLASSDTIFGLSRMFMAHTSSHEVTTHVFRTVSEADGWLGIGVEMEEILARTPD